MKGYTIVPYPLGTPQWESFKNYAVAYYKEAITLTREVQTTDETAYRAMLNAVMSPLVFLWEKWQLMSLDDKLKYATPEYKAHLEKIKAESQKVKDVVKEEKWAE